MATLHGPVSVDFVVPTAVTLSRFEAADVASGELPAVGAWLALLAPLAGVAVGWRRRAAP